MSQSFLRAKPLHSVGARGAVALGTITALNLDAVSYQLLIVLRDAQCILLAGVALAMLKCICRQSAKLLLQQEGQNTAALRV